MAGALECWSGRPSTDEDMVEQVLMNNPDRSELIPNSNSNPSSGSSPSSPSHYPNNNSNNSSNRKKWQQRISKNLAGAIASLKNSLNIDSSSSSTSSSSQRLDKLVWGAVVRNLTQLYPGSQLPEKLISDIRSHFDSLPPSYAHANFDMKDVLLHLRLIDQAAAQDNNPAVNIDILKPENSSKNDESKTETEEERLVFRLTFAYSSSILWTSISSSALDPDTVSCLSIQIFDRKGLALGIATLSVLAGHEKQFRDRIETAFRSAAKKPTRSNVGVKLPFGLCGCQEDCPNPSALQDDDVEADDRIVHLSSPLPRTSILVSVDERRKTVVSGAEEAWRWILAPSEVEFGDRAGNCAFRGCCRGRKVWIKKLRGCERGNNGYEIEMRQDLLQLMSCGQRNILRFLGICVDDGNGLCIVTRMMDGGSVHDLIQRGKRMEVKEVMRIASDVAQGLMFMNGHGVAYRDLNAQRILMDKQGNSCLGDMGVVSCCRNAGEVTEYETAGYRWLAPEIIAGDPESVTETWMSNVYSFGMVVWEMVTGEAAYSSYSPVQAAVGITACGLRPEIPKDCPQVLRSLMMKCWNNCPFKRPTFPEIISILQKQNNR